MKYNLIMSDFDGTALNSSRTASRRTKDAIRRYREAGGNFVICTGRMFESIVANAHLLGLQDVNMPVCALDGGIIKESKTGKLIALSTMPYEQTAAFARDCEALGCYFQVYSEDKLFVAEENEINRHYCDISKIEMHPVGKLSDYIERNKLKCVKVLIADEAAARAEQYLDRFKDKYKDIRFFMSCNTYLDGAALSAGKGNALKTLCKYLGVDMGRTIAIGDSMNDISMVEEAALGVAMGNADGRLKEVADLVAPSCDEDGVADIIERALADAL